MTVKDPDSVGHGSGTPTPSPGTQPSQTPRIIDAASLFRAHARFVANFLHRLGLHRDEIDDAVQDVFIVVHRRGGFEDRGQARPTTWLAAIASRVASTRRRTRRRARVRADGDVVDVAASSDAGPSRNVEARRGLERVQAALSELDSDRRVVFVLFELEGESCADIAAALEIPVGTVYSRLHKARKEFKTVYARIVGDEEARR
jgi:RNA polymerase sigma-70 factor (ECF subfamily)